MTDLKWFKATILSLSTKEVINYNHYELHAKDNQSILKLSKEWFMIQNNLLLRLEYLLFMSIVVIVILLL